MPESFPAPGPAEAGGCLSDDELAAAAAGELAARTDHLDRCEACRRAVSALAGVEDSTVTPGARDLGDDPTEPAEPLASASDDGLAPGQRIGRFTVVRKLGQGGMGQVWAARDPELERDVAIKLLHVRTEELGVHATVRLRREAQAMARLTHPNVVRIYELGADGGRVFCAMELIDGVTLRGWLETPRGWRAVIDVALAIGRGLAAAHAAGLVHRDIKPDNVLIARDGRILVTDFGLAKLIAPDRDDADEAAATATLPSPGDAVTTLPQSRHRVALAALATTAQLPPPQPPQPPQLADLTAVGMVVGTPAYMAPEQLEGRRVEAHTDQFAYCVMIYEALFGVRPFAGATIDELADAVARGVGKPERAGVPRAIVRCLVRGLAFAPQQRWPAMTALLAELERIVARPRRVRLAVGGVLALALIGGGVVWAWPVDRAGEVRAAAESRISAAWGAPQRAQLEAAFVTAGGAAAHEELAVVTKVLDAYRADWLAMRVDAWAAHHVRGEQSAPLLERRLACLDELAGKLAAVVKVLGTASRAEVTRAPKIVHRLTPVTTCAELHRLEARTPPPSTPAGRAAEDKMRALESLQLAGRSDEALAQAQQMVDEAEALAEPGVLARAVHNLGMAQANVAHRDAEATLRRAVQLSAAARDHVLVAEGWLRLFSLVGLDQGRPKDAMAFEVAVRAAVAQAGDDPRQQAELATSLGMVAEARGDYLAARAHHTEARARHVEARGPDHPHVAMTETNLAGALLSLGEYDEAERLLERALASVQASMGETNPIASPALQNLSSIAARRKDWPASERHLRAAIKINAKVFRTDHPELGKHYVFLARALREQRRFDEAARALAEGRRIMEATLPATHRMRASLDFYDAQLAEAQGRFPEAERLGKRGLAAVRVAVAPDHPQLAWAVVEQARFVAYRSPAEALDLYDEGMRIHTARAGRERSGDADTLPEIARAALAARQPARALAWFDKLPDAAATLPELRAELDRARAAGK